MKGWSQLYWCGFRWGHEAALSTNVNTDCVSLCRGCGFVQFPDERLQKRALEECQGAVGLGGKPLRLSLAANKWVLGDFSPVLSMLKCLCLECKPNDWWMSALSCYLPLEFKEQAAAAAAAVRAQIVAVQLRIQKRLWPVQPVPAAAGLSWVLPIMGLWPDWRRLCLQLSAVWLQSISPTTGKLSLSTASV